MSGPEAALRAEHVTKSYGGRTVIQDVSLRLEQGELVCLLGISGAGKTTLFHSLSGLERPEEGRVLLFGEDVTGTPGKISYMLQRDLLLPHKKIPDNAALPLVIRGVRAREARERALSYFPQFGLEGTEDKYPAQLSGGMRQRAALLRTFLGARGVALLDEPFSALDENLREDMRALVLSLHREFHMTTVLVTHDRGEALSMSGRVALLFDGAVEQCGTPREVYLHPATRRAADYFGGCIYLDGEVRGGVFHCGLVTLPASQPEGRYTLCLREQMWRPAGNGPYALTVKEVRFRGPETMVALAAEDGTLFHKRFPGPAPFQAGDVLRFHLDVGDPVLFPREEGL